MALVGPPATAAHDPDDIGYSDQAGDQPQQGAGDRAQCQANTQAQREDQEGGGEDGRLQEHSHYHHAVHDTLGGNPLVSCRSVQSSLLTAHKPRPGRQPGQSSNEDHPCRL